MRRGAAAHHIFATAFTIVTLIVLSSCSKAGDASSTADKMIALINAGKCTDTKGVPAAAVATWTSFCQELRSYMPAGTQLGNVTTTTRDSGEIGKTYESKVVFRNNFGVDQTVFFDYDGVGNLANKPVLQGASSQINIAFRAKNVFTYSSAVTSAPAAEQLLDEVYRLLESQRCEELKPLVLAPLEPDDDRQFSEACAQKRQEGYEDRSRH
jgi:hypothetical protein